MKEFEFKISSKEKFVNILRHSIDNEKHFFSLSKRKYSGYYNISGFNLNENQIKIYYVNFYKIHGKIESDKVKVKLKPSSTSYFLIIFYSILFVMFFMGLFLTEDSWLFMIFLSALILKSLLFVYRFSKRKNIIYRDFKRMSNGLNTSIDCDEQSSVLSS